MKQSVFYFLHLAIVLLVAIVIFFETDQLTSYYKTPFLFNLLDSTLFFGSLLGLIYLAYWLFIPQYLVKSQYATFSGGLLVIVSGFALCFYLATSLARHLFTPGFHLFVPPGYSAILTISVSVGMAGTFLRIFVEWIKDAETKAELQRQNIKSELSLLKSQLNPHFLFNTINNIDSLIVENPVNASLALNKLSEIMRYVVYDSERTLAPLEDEIHYLQNYIALQKLRIQNPGIVQFEVSGEVTNKSVAPMLFIPFVENIFKHASLKDRPGNVIKIAITATKNKLHLYCFNRLSDIQKDTLKGVGLAIVKKRLDLIYTNSYLLDIQKTASDFSVNLEIDFSNGKN